jgi:branched-chain amino acid transport system permease protein
MLSRNKYTYLVAGLVLAISAPFLDNYILYICSLNFIFIIISLGYNLVMGFAGQISLCQGAFAALGAYISALLTIKLGINFWLALGISASITTAIGFAIGFPAIRLSGHYLALVTLGFNTIVEIVARIWSKMTGGSFGLIVPRPSLPFVDFSKDIHHFYFNLIIMTLFIILTINILNSKVGRSLMAIRDSETGSISLGINPARYKTIAFMLSAFYGAIGGGLYAITIGLVTPDDFNLLRVLKFLTGIVIGGLGSIIGTILGSVSITTLPEVLRVFEDFEELIYGVVLILFLKFLPKGLVSLKEKVEEKFSKVSGEQHGAA